MWTWVCYTVDAPTALWWKQLATAVVFGLGLATVLTLVVTPSMLAIRVWGTTAIQSAAAYYLRLRHGKATQTWADRKLHAQARKLAAEDVNWVTDIVPPKPARKLKLRNPLPTTPQAAE